METRKLDFEIGKRVIVSDLVGQVGEHLAIAPRLIPANSSTKHITLDEGKVRMSAWTSVTTASHQPSTGPSCAITRLPTGMSLQDFGRGGLPAGAAGAGTALAGAVAAADVLELCSIGLVMTSSSNRKGAQGPSKIAVSIDRQNDRVSYR